MWHVLKLNIIVWLCVHRSTNKLDIQYQYKFAVCTVGLHLICAGIDMLRSTQCVPKPLEPWILLEGMFMEFPQKWKLKPTHRFLELLLNMHYVQHDLSNITCYTASVSQLRTKVWRTCLTCQTCCTERTATRHSCCSRPCYVQENTQNTIFLT